MIMAKSSGKNTTGVGRDVKNDDGIIPPLDARGKDKIQPTITSFLAVGVQESYTEHIVPPPANSQSVIEAVPSGTSRERALIETNESLIKVSQGDDGLPGVLDSRVVTKATKKRGSGFPISKNGHQKQQSKILAGGEVVCDMDDTIVTLSTEVLQYVAPESTVGDKKIGKSLKPPDWAKDDGDKLYSLTKESDLNSSEHNLSESGSSISSETGSISSSNEPTVRQQRRHQTRIENRCARVATKRLQGTIRKVAKSCTEIEAKLNTMEERTAGFEADVEALREQCATQDGQLTDIMWKLEDTRIGREEITCVSWVLKKGRKGVIFGLM
ncbi:hypothetical protein NDU88_003408 [Pleurodeles waltl]|uniref:Uncharacterized protein n=1 Tax=Pleurodeles waltl TaxID=8319 RepID=A0AAV7KY23_PLEWA|nr:hypothetical protein NDU88_003408 [Pleurodeles waltl]